MRDRSMEERWGALSRKTCLRSCNVVSGAQSKVKGGRTVRQSAYEKVTLMWAGDEVVKWVSTGLEATAASEEAGENGCGAAGTSGRPSTD